MDVFNGQMTEPVKDMTNLFQPLDLTVNGSVKALTKQKVTELYSKQIAQALDGVPLDDIDIKLNFFYAFLSWDDDNPR